MGVTPEVLLEFLARNQEPISARGLHEILGIRQPYGLWLYGKVLCVPIYLQPDDYCFVQRDGRRDCDLSPTVALIAATGGGSPFAAKVQVAFCRWLSEHVFKGRSPIEVIETGIKCVEAERLLERSFDPERDR